MNFQITSIPDLCSSYVQEGLLLTLMWYLILTDICGRTQKDRFTCPGVNTYFTAAVLFGSLGAKKVFGTGGLYTPLLSAFPVGFLIPIIYYYATKRIAPTHWLRQVHPVLLLTGAHAWSPVSA